ncbi:hypothetical protein ACFFWD_29320, partial [Bradyrhizobium erythrophlei]|uniref:hypothetical protein n=1 Tax=Bradyrhizobium erythrophlei TaxID=1437360 RepID=UPI0035EEA96A
MLKASPDVRFSDWSTAIRRSARDWSGGLDLAAHPPHATDLPDRARAQVKNISVLKKGKSVYESA